MSKKRGIKPNSPTKQGKIISVYILTDPLSGKVRYVGSSKHPERRYKQHLKDAEKIRTDKQKWIMELIEQGDAPKIKVIDYASTEDEAVNLEEKYVLQHIDTVLNIHMPGKNHGYVEHYRQTGVLDKRGSE